MQKWLTETQQQIRCYIFCNFAPVCLSLRREPGQEAKQHLRQVHAHRNSDAEYRRCAEKSFHNHHSFCGISHIRTRQHTILNRGYARAARSWHTNLFRLRVNDSFRLESTAPLTPSTTSHLHTTRRTISHFISAYQLAEIVCRYRYDLSSTYRVSYCSFVLHLGAQLISSQFIMRKDSRK